MWDCPHTHLLVFLRSAFPSLFSTMGFCSGVLKIRNTQGSSMENEVAVCFPSFLSWEVPLLVRANPAMLFLRRELSTPVFVVVAVVILVLCEEQNIYPAMASSGQSILDSHKPPQLWDGKQRPTHPVNFLESLCFYIASTFLKDPPFPSPRQCNGILKTV